MEPLLPPPSSRLLHPHAIPSPSSSSTSRPQVRPLQLNRTHRAGAITTPPPPRAHHLLDAMLSRAEAGDVAQAEAIWAQLLHSSTPPGPAAASRLLQTYARLGRLDAALAAARDAARRDAAAGRRLYSLAASLCGAAGDLGRMEAAVREMASRGLPVDSATGNAFVRHYAAFGSVAQMEAAFRRLKNSALLVDKAAIRAMASTYIKNRQYYRLGEFLKDAGLRRRDAGNLLWNLRLLSFAAEFKMKSLQREFLAMLDAGFAPDVTTFNVRALAFSKMCMLWDLHLSAEHMRRDGVAPDLVTYGCFVDAYLERRLAKNLRSFAFRGIGEGGGGGEAAAEVATDAVVFEAFGKGGFHASSEVLIEARGEGRRWTYSRLLGVYLRKQYRKNQVFWNY